MADIGCPCAACTATRGYAALEKEKVTAAEAGKRAETLLLAQLTPEQAADWTKNMGFNVRGSAGNLWRLNARFRTNHAGVLREDGIGVHVWPIGLEIEADWALGLLLHLVAHESRVYEAGCKDRVYHRGVKAVLSHYAAYGRVARPSSYDGKL